MKNLNLAPLEELLTTGITPQELAEELDEILFDYIQSVVNLHLRRNENEDFIHDRVPDYIYRIKELRDVLWKCTE